MTFAPLPFVQSIPHAGQAAPAELQGLLALDPVAIYNECDLWVDQLFDFSHPCLNEITPGGRALGTLALVKTDIARAIIDVNRPPTNLDDPDGAIKAKTSYGLPAYASPLDVQQKVTLRDIYWTDYHTRLQAALKQWSGAVRLLLDCHNMAQRGPTTYGDPGKPRPFICLANLGDQNGEIKNGRALSCPPWLLRAAGELASELFGDMDLLEPDGDRPPVVALNSPFAGGYIVKRYTHGLPAHGAEDALENNVYAPMAIMVEINRGLFVGNQTATTPIAPPNAEPIAAIRSRLYRWAVALSAQIDQVYG